MRAPLWGRRNSHVNCSSTVIWHHVPMPGGYPLTVPVPVSGGRSDFPAWSAILSARRVSYCPWSWKTLHGALRSAGTPNQGGSMRRVLKSVLFRFALVGLLVSAASPLKAETFDGRWQGTYSCGPHRLRPMGAFTWPIAFDIKNGLISGRHAYTGGINNKPAAALFYGAMNSNGSTEIDATTDRRNPTETWCQKLIGRAISSTVINLTGPLCLEQTGPQCATVNSH